MGETRVAGIYWHPEMMAGETKQQLCDGGARDEARVPGGTAIARANVRVT